MKYYDFNSLYPSAMKNRFPDPSSAKVSYRNDLWFIKSYEGMSDVDVYCPEDMRIPLLPFRTKEKLIFPVGSFRGVYTHLELRRAVELGYVIKRVHKSLYYRKTCRPFDRYVDDLYGMRMRWKRENNPMQLVAKLLLNSLYGKFGQKFIGREGLIHEEQITLKVLKEQKAERIEGTEYFRTKQTTNPAVFCIPIWAAYVTAYGRIRLFDTLIRCENPAYCDTDSIMTEDELPVSNELGALKLEMSINVGVVVRPKMYAVVDMESNSHVKIKGIGRKLLYKDFLLLIMDKPVAEYRRFAKIRESLRRGFVPNQVIDVSKEISLEDDKRVWREQFNPLLLQQSMPVNLMEGIDERIVMEGVIEDAKKRRKEQMEALEKTDALDSMGKDITKEEFIENEIFWETR